MRFTFLSPHDLLTGGSRVMVQYASLLQARGHEVLVVSNRDAPVTLRDHLRALRNGRWGELRREMSARRQPGHVALSGLPQHVLDRYRPITAADVPDADVIVATWWETAKWMHAMPASKGRKVHLLQGYEIWGGGAVKSQVQDTLRLPNLKIAISAGLKREIEGDIGDLGIRVINNAVDGGHFDAPPRQRRTPPTVGFIYANDLIKGPDRCFKVIERLRRRIPDLRVLAFGAQQPTPDLPLPDGTEFHFRPAQDRIPELYARCDAWLFATRVDSFGLPILESMACRTPVVGVPVGVAPDFLTGGAGLLVDASPEEALRDALAEALYGLLTGPEEAWRDMSKRAHARAHAYTWEDAIDNFEALIAECASRRTCQCIGECTWKILTQPAALPA